jgi:2-oxo-4-hydroxy-4-carboxy-5-ureidoimidazoline decarboxylase
VSTALLTIAELSILAQEAFVGHIGPVYEHSPWIAAATWPRRPFASVDELRHQLNATLFTAPKEEQLALIQAHPDLAGRLAQAGQLTDESTQEQKSAGLDRLLPAEAVEFNQLNRAYLDRFGFPFVICARLNDRAAILQAFRRRLTNDREQEIAAALTQIDQIAALRLAQIVRD